MPDTKEVKSVKVTGIEDTLSGEIATAYEAHKAKDSPPTDKHAVAEQVVQYLQIFRAEKIGFEYVDEGHHLVAHANGNLFVDHDAYEVVTANGQSGNGAKIDGVPRPQGRAAVIETLADRYSTRALSHCLIKAAKTLSDAPNVGDVDDDNRQSVNLKRAIDKMVQKAATKEELAELLKSLVG
jgi:hypothetical protein